MGDWLIGFGIILVLVGPALNLLVIWGLHRLIMKLPLGRLSIKDWRISVVLSCTVWALALFISYMPGRLQFDDMCAAEGRPVISETYRAEGFLRSRLYPHEAQRYLSEQGFTYVETPHMYKPGVYSRYTLDETGSVVSTETETAVSRFTVEESFTETAGISATRKVILDGETGTQIARASMLHYRGGPLSILLGVGFNKSCPDILSEQGSHDFRVFYDLEKFVLSGESTLAQ